jgi:hypothetical protein
MQQQGKDHTLLLYFQPVAPAQNLGGRPLSGPGSHGGTTSANQRDGRSRRLAKRVRSAARADDESDSEDDEPAEKRFIVQRTNWSTGDSAQQLQQALQQLGGGASMRSVAKRTRIPLTVLHRHAHGAGAPGRPPALGVEVERVLAEHVLEKADRGFGMTVLEIRQLAAVLYTRLPPAQGSRPFLANKRWWVGFTGRHPEVARRRAQVFECLRARAMNEPLIKHYFLLLQAAYETIQKLSGGAALTADRMHNMDELGFQLYGGVPYIIARRGAKHVVSISSNSRVTTSLAVTASADGHVMPPYFILRGQRAPAHYLRAAPPGSALVMATKGMMTTAAFREWQKHFLACMRPRDPQHWSLLLLDGHHSHTMDPEVMQTFRDHRVYVLALPSHTTAALQLLDVAVFGPLKRAWRRWVHEYQRSSPMVPLDKYDVPRIMGDLWPKISGEHIRKGAQATGLYPLDVDWCLHNAHQFAVNKTVSAQPTIPGTLAFVAYRTCAQALAGLDLAMSPLQQAEFAMRIRANIKVNAIGESMQQARLLNTEERIKLLLAAAEARMELMREKQMKKKAREQGREQQRAAKLLRMQAKEQERQRYEPLILRMVKDGFHADIMRRPTVAAMRAFAKRNRVALKAGMKKNDMSNALLTAVTKERDRRWEIATHGQLLEPLTEDDDSDDSSDEETEDTDSDDD